MKAIILAAGMGTRLGKYTESLPKCMLNFNGKTLIERQVETLRKCGITDITIVKGYMPEKIDIPNTKTYLNSDYPNTNMVETLFCAEAEMDDDILICYADIIYEEKVLQTILDSPSDVGVTVDEDYWEYWQSRADNPEDDMESLIIEDGRIVDLGNTKCTREDAKVRYVGLIKLSKAGVQKLREVYHQNKIDHFLKNKPWLRSKSFKKAYMTCLIQALINSGQEVKPITIRRGWLEFDTVEDYERYVSWADEGNLGRFLSLDN
ncbi:hypothetical protein COV20_04010 [Candidatus Woesearchaeota archaeon CG10_big_fil_rev_8_21_14_0_10_45_16]|nr:MAG: hypothetical protein COV20_04010 [Candidatus Woesearchaeota archaeon CG10_big_fil_rev_8_21_14_0_10_45_16]